MQYDLMENNKVFCSLYDRFAGIKMNRKYKMYHFEIKDKSIFGYFLMMPDDFDNLIQYITEYSDRYKEVELLAFVPMKLVDANVDPGKSKITINSHESCYLFHFESDETSVTFPFTDVVKVTNEIDLQIDDPMKQQKIFKHPLIFIFVKHSNSPRNRSTVVCCIAFFQDHISISFPIFHERPGFVNMEEDIVIDGNGYSVMNQTMPTRDQFEGSGRYTWKYDSAVFSDSRDEDRVQFTIEYDGLESIKRIVYTKTSTELCVVKEVKQIFAFDEVIKG